MKKTFQMNAPLEGAIKTETMSGKRKNTKDKCNLNKIITKYE
jgi:hypothetical protein